MKLILQAVKSLLANIERRLENSLKGLSAKVDGKANSENPAFTGSLTLNYNGVNPVGQSAIVVGENTTASGVASHAEGQQTVASGTACHAEGIGTRAWGIASHAEGELCEAKNEASHAEGYSSEATGIYSHAEGYNTTASGAESHSEGRNTTASAQGSHAEGYGTIAASEYQHTLGKYNVEDTDDIYAQIVGNGSAHNARSNAHTLDWDGNAWFKGKVFVGGTSMDDATELGTGGGGGIDELLDDDGKIKPEFLPDSGGTTVILPETEAIYNAGMGAFVIISVIDASMFTEGQTYTVNWNGTDYEAKAQPTSYNGMTGIALGDVGILQGAPTTGEPFMVAVLDAASKAATSVAALIVPIDGSTSVTVSISGKPTYDVTENATIFVDIYGTIGGTYHGSSTAIPENIQKRSHTNAEILALVKGGRNVIIRNFPDADFNDYFKYYHLEEFNASHALFAYVRIDSSVFTCSEITVRSSGEMTMYERAIV